MNWPSHGANSQYLYEKAGIKQPETVIDFSANINPLGPPPVIKEIWEDAYSSIHHYPDPYAKRLIRKMAIKESILESQIIVGNGAAELISIIGRFLAGKKVLLIQPTFSEYEEVCKVNGCEVYYYTLSDANQWKLQLEDVERHLKDVDAVFFCNPTNPTGVYEEKEIVVGLLDRCNANDCFLILDEAFFDFVQKEENYLPLLQQYDRFIILRSLTKMYSIPGIRLGYLFANEQIINNLTSYQPHWSVNGIALQLGELLLEQEVFVERTKEYIQKEREQLISFFRDQQFLVSNSQVNFYLVRDPFLEDQKDFFYFLLKKGIVARHTYNYPGLDGRWLRFAVKGEAENQKLRGAVKEWRNR